MAASGGASPSLTRMVSGTLVGSRTPADFSADAGQEEPLNRTTSGSAVDRERFEENRRAVAEQMLGGAIPVLAFLSLTLLACLFVGIIIWVSGWIVFTQHGDKPCDQPLKWWLLVVLCMPIVQCNGNCQNDSCLKRLNVFVMPVVIAVGIWMYFHCETCQATNPELYQFVRLYLIYQTVVWVLMVFSLIGLVSIVFWMAHHGMLDTGSGSGGAAKPGLIHDIETVDFSTAILACQQEEGDEKPPAECCICQAEFDAQTRIKRTPCGHFFHEECLGNWLRNAKSCPLCRQNLEEALEDVPLADRGDNAV